MKTHKQSGNVLFIIIIVIAIFAALSYTVGNMMRGGNAEKVRDEKIGLYVDEVLDYARQVKQAVQSLRISNGCDVTEISFTRQSGDAYEHSPTASDSCKVFHVSGGAINAASPSLDITTNDYFFTGSLGVSGIGSDTEAELTLILRGVGREFCGQINANMGIGAPLADDSANANFYSVPFTGTYLISGDIGSTIGTGLAMYDNRPVGCFLEDNASGGEYFFYSVLAPQ
jgi:hypothetical protein